MLLFARGSLIEGFDGGNALICGVAVGGLSINGIEKRGGSVDLSIFVSFVIIVKDMGQNRGLISPCGLFLVEHAADFDVLGAVIPFATGLGKGYKATKGGKAIAGKITGYTRHGLNQAISRNAGRGVKAKAILEAVRNPRKVIQQADKTIKYVGKEAIVFLNKQG